MSLVIEQPEWFRKAVKHQKESFYISVEGCKIHYQHWVQSDKKIKKPPLLLVHGGGAHAHWWDFLAPSFIDNYDVLAIDLSGMGDSEHRKAYSDSLYAKELLAVCKHAGHTENISLISHSYGGRSVLTLALENPEALRSVIITDCFLFSPSERAEVMGQKSVPDSPFGKKKVYPSKEAGLERFKLIPPQICNNQYLVDYVADFSLGPVEGGWSWKFDMNFVNKLEQSLTKNNLIDEIHNIGCPVANLYGENSILFPESLVDLYKQKFPAHTRFHCLADAQHHLLLDQPEAFIEVLKNILVDLDSDIAVVPKSVTDNLFNGTTTKISPQLYHAK